MVRDIDVFFSTHAADPGKRTSLVNLFRSIFTKHYTPSKLLQLDDTIFVHSQCLHDFVNDPIETYDAIRAAANTFSSYPHFIAINLRSIPLTPNIFPSSLVCIDAKVLSFKPIMTPARPGINCNCSPGYLLEVDLLSSFKHDSEDVIILPQCLQVKVLEGPAMDGCFKRHNICRFFGVLKQFELTKKKVLDIDYYLDCLSCVSLTDLDSVSFPLSETVKNFTPSVFGMSSIKLVLLLSVITPHISRPNILITGGIKSGKSLLLKGMATLPLCYYLRSGSKMKEVVRILDLAEQANGIVLVDDIDDYISSIKSVLQHFVFIRTLTVIATSKPSVGRNSTSSVLSQSFDLCFELTALQTHGEVINLGKHLTNPLTGKSRLQSSTVLPVDAYSPRRTPQRSLRRAPSPWTPRPETPQLSQLNGQIEEESDQEIFPDEVINKQVALVLGVIMNVNYNVEWQLSSSGNKEVNQAVMDLLKDLIVIDGRSENDSIKLTLKRVLIGLCVSLIQFNTFPECPSCIHITGDNIKSCFHLIKKALYNSSTVPNNNRASLPLPGGRQGGRMGKAKAIKESVLRLSRLYQLNNNPFTEKQVIEVINSIAPNIDSREVLNTMSDQGLLLKKNFSGKVMFVVSI
ncbi:hypothetical protein P9112_004777 [Eukaryota sp. TZLM1-RC]